jgi:inosose dehydratase
VIPNQGGTVSELQIGCGQITWPRTTPEEEILAEIAQAGYAGAPGDARSAERTPQEILDLFGRFGLRPAPGYLGGNFWNPDQADALVHAAADKARLMRELGCTELYVSANLTPERRAASGHVGPGDMLDAAGFANFAATLNRVAEATLREGVRTCYHNHVGSFIETREEVDRLFALVDRSLVFLGPDTGHLAWGGADVVQFCRDYADSIKTIHIKDIDPGVRSQGVAAGWDYATFSQHGIFTEIGEGLVDFPTIFAILSDANFSGWVITETDVTQQPTALDSATISRNNLRRWGI